MSNNSTVELGKKIQLIIGFLNVSIALGLFISVAEADVGVELLGYVPKFDRKHYWLKTKNGTYLIKRSGLPADLASSFQRSNATAKREKFSVPVSTIFRKIGTANRSKGARQ